MQKILAFHAVLVGMGPVCGSGAGSEATAVDSTATTTGVLATTEEVPTATSESPTTVIFDDTTSIGDVTSTGFIPEPVCGDGKLDDNEDCDDVKCNILGGCTLVQLSTSRCYYSGCDVEGCDATSCVSARCGDGIPNKSGSAPDGAAEACDDTICAVDGGCNLAESRCFYEKQECNFSGCGGGSCVPATCGDGEVNISDPESSVVEGCDDGAFNKLPEVSQHSDCLIDSCLKPFCGDGAKNLDEECDDSNSAPYDGCNPACQNELIAFVTSVKFTIANDDMFLMPTEINGVASAHVACQETAENAGMAGSYKAWVSDVAAGPSEVGWGLVEGRAILRRDGKVVVKSGVDLLSVDNAHKLSNAISLDENAMPLPARGGEGMSEDWFVWTGTQTTGVTSGNHCSNWSGLDELATVGVADDEVVDGGWTQITSGFGKCSGAYRLYCIGVVE